MANTVHLQQWSGNTWVVLDLPIADVAWRLTLGERIEIEVGPGEWKPAVLDTHATGDLSGVVVVRAELALEAGRPPAPTKQGAAMADDGSDIPDWTAPLPDNVDPTVTPDGGLLMGGDPGAGVPGLGLGGGLDSGIDNLGSITPPPGAPPDWSVDVTPDLQQAVNDNTGVTPDVFQQTVDNADAQIQADQQQVQLESQGVDATVDNLDQTAIGNLPVRQNSVPPVSGDWAGAAGKLGQAAAQTATGIAQAQAQARIATAQAEAQIASAQAQGVPVQGARLGTVPAPAPAPGTQRPPGQGSRPGGVGLPSVSLGGALSPQPGGPQRPGQPPAARPPQVRAAGVASTGDAGILIAGGIAVLLLGTAAAVALGRRRKNKAVK